MIEFRTLGTLDLRDTADGRTLQSVLAQPKVTAVLAYIALARPRAFHHRDTMLGIFWPETTQERARHSLNQALYVLRRAFGNGPLVTRGPNQVGLDFDRFWCDAAELDAKLEAGEPAAALELYGGELLEGFYLSGCRAFERWLEAERAALRERAVQAALGLADAQEAAGDPVEAIHWVRRAAEWVPYDEAVLRRLLGLLRGQRDRAGAVREYEAFQRRLATDLELEPPADLAALVEAIRAENGEPALAAVDEETGASKATALSAVAAPRGGGVATARPAPRLWLGVTGIVAAFIIVLLAAAGVFAPRGPTPAEFPGPTLDANRVLVTEFENMTGDSTLDLYGRLAAEWVAQEVVNTGFVRVVPFATALREAPLLEADIQDEGDRSLARILAEHTGAGLFIHGVYERSRDSLSINAQLVETASGVVLRQIESVRVPSDAPLDAVQTLRQRVVGALATVLDPRLSSWAAAATQPPSFEAYRVYADGMDLLLRSRIEFNASKANEMQLEAKRIFRRAADLDSSFTLPLIWALEASRNMIMVADTSLIRELQARRHRLPPWERAMLDYHATATDWRPQAEYDAIRRVVDLAPGSEWILVLTGAAVGVNRPREAVELLSGLDPDMGWLKSEPLYWRWLGSAQSLLGDYEGVLRTVERGRARHGDDPSLYFQEVEALAALGRVEEATERAITILETTGQSGTIYLRYTIPQVIRARGYHEEARQVAEVALTTFERIDHSRPSYLQTTLVEAGRYEEARAHIRETYPEVDTGIPPPTGWGGYMSPFRNLAYMAAKQGNAEEAIRYSNQARAIGGAYGNQISKAWGTMIQAEVAAHLGDKAKAVRLLREAYGHGLRHGPYIYQRWDLTPLYGYRPFEELVRPKG